MSELADKLRRLRHERHYSQEYVAEGLGISQPAYWKIENSKTNPSIAILEKLAKIYNLSLRDLVKKETASN